MASTCLTVAGRRRWCLVAALLWCAATRVATAGALGPDGVNGERYHGKFIWFELVTDDPGAAREFYRSVFGWSFHTVPGAPAAYTLIENAGSKVAGMFVHARGRGSAHSARWLTLISVPEPEATAQYALQHGGAVVAPVASIAGRGTHALLRDPEGVLFGVLRTENGDPPDTPVADGEFFWVDLLAGDQARAAEFYRELAGYHVSVRDTDAGFARLVLESQGYWRGGIVPRPPRLKESGWVPYVLVGDVPATIQKVRAAKGEVLVQPHAQLLDGNLAVIADPLGGVLGIVNWENADTGADR